MIAIKRTEQPLMGEHLIRETQRLQDYINHIRKETADGKEKGVKVSRSFYYKNIRDIDANWYKQLVEVFHGKCAYCETRIGDLGEVDHFRPASGVKEVEGQYHEFHYIWLAYNWTNLYLACTKCISNKRNYFPVEGERVQPWERVKKELPLLIDPCLDSPEMHLYFERNGIVNAKTIKGKFTIDILNLNRSELIELRRESVDKLESLFKDSNLLGFNQRLLQLRKLIECDNFHVGIIKQLIFEWIKGMDDFKKQDLFSNNKYRDFLKDIYGAFNSQFHFMDKFYVFGEKKLLAERDIPNTQEYNKKLIKEIQIKDIRGVSFKHTFNLEGKNPGWLMLIGENGTGKTSVLQAITLAMLDNWSGLGVKQSSYASKGKVGSITIKFANEIGLNEVIFHRKHENRVQTVKQIPIIAYGSTRLIPKTNSKRSNQINMNVKNLFATSSNSYFLRNPREWMRDEKTIREVSKAILDVLPFGDDEQVDLIYDKKFYLIRGDNKPVELQDLSSGYQSIIAIVMDIMRAISSVTNSGHLTEGIVLIDEIDAHLHPSWKMRIVDNLRRAFPYMQFIVTSHDPLCLRGIYSEEIIVFKRYRNSINVINEVPDPAGLRIDQILTSELFGMNSTIDIKYDELISNYQYQLTLPHEERTEDFQEIKNNLDKFSYLGATNRERILYEVIDEYISKRKLQNKPYHKIDKETQKRLVELWKNYEVDET